jgi:DNA-binding response OmpR family regulator
VVDSLKKVLIVDDNQAITEIVSEIITTSGYQPFSASGGREALVKIEVDKPDLILLDVNMPDIDGYTLLRQLKEKGVAGDLKILMLTSAIEVDTDIFGLQDVISGYIRKPFNNADLEARLREALEEPDSPERLISPDVKEKKKGGFAKLFKKAEKEDIESFRSMETTRRSKKVYELKKGYAYLVKEVKPKKSFDIFVDQVTHDIQGLCVTRQHPSVIRKDWGLEKTPIIWLTNQLGKVYINPTNIGILGETITRFIEKSGDSIVIIDGIEFLIINNDFEKVLRMLHNITDAAMENRSRLIISIDPRTLQVRELALLERNMEIIEDKVRAASQPNK